MIFYFYFYFNKMTPYTTYTVEQYIEKLFLTELKDWPTGLIPLVASYAEIGCYVEDVSSNNHDELLLRYGQYIHNTGGDTEAIMDKNGVTWFVRSNADAKHSSTLLTIKLMSQNSPDDHMNSHTSLRCTYASNSPFSHNYVGITIAQQPDSGEIPIILYTNDNRVYRIDRNGIIFLFVLPKCMLGVKTNIVSDNRHIYVSYNVVIGYGNYTQYMTVLSMEGKILGSYDFFDIIDERILSIGQCIDHNGNHLIFIEDIWHLYRFEWLYRENELYYEVSFINIDVKNLKRPELYTRSDGSLNFIDRFTAGPGHSKYKGRIIRYQ